MIDPVAVSEPAESPLGAPHAPDARPSDDESFHPNADELLANNEQFAAQFADSGLALAPRRRLAIVACMDSRMDIFQILGLDHGDAHVVRNAGGVVTSDVERSLVLSQRSLGTREILLIHHTNCGLHNVSEDDFKNALEAEVGIRPAWPLESFTDPYADVRQSIHRLHLSPFLLHKRDIRGFVYDVSDGRLREVLPDPRLVSS